MDSIEFIDLFKNIIEINHDHTKILEDLNNNIFPFHNKEKHISTRRYYYWLKQNNSLRFKNLNGELKKLIKNKIKSNFENNNNNNNL